MNDWNQSLIILARSGMELSWRYAWAVFVSLLAVQLAFPLPAAVCAMILGAIITRISVAGNWRNYQKIGLQFAGFMIVSLMILYWIRYPGTAFWDFNWLHDLLVEAKSLPQWLTLLVLFFFLWLFWQGGRLLIKDPHSYMPICMQFDKGLGLFMLLLVAYALVDARTDLDLHNQGIRFAILAFFTFSLASIALSRYHTQGQKSFITGYHGIGVILSALIISILFATGIMLLAYPYLFHKADALLVILKDTAQPFAPLLIRLLIFFFRPRHIKLYGDVQDENIPSIEGMEAPVVEGWLAILFKLLGAGLIVLSVLAILFVLGFLIFKLLEWLLKKDPDAEKPFRLTRAIKRFLAAIPAIIGRCWSKLIDLLKGIYSAAMVYYRMLRWGKFSGLPARPSDTPKEYGYRLMQTFPELKAEINIIVESFNQEIYGRVFAGKETFARLASAQRHMRRLRYWPSRLHTWLRH